MAGAVFIIALAADHGGVVAAQAQGRDKQLLSLSAHGGFKIMPDAGICGHTAGDGHPLASQLARGGHGARHKAGADCGGKAGAQRGDIQRLAALLCSVYEVDDGCFQAGKAHVIGMIRDVTDGEMVFFVVSAL